MKKLWSIKIGFIQEKLCNKSAKKGRKWIHKMLGSCIQRKREIIKKAWNDFLTLIPSTKLLIFLQRKFINLVTCSRLRIKNFFFSFASCHKPNGHTRIWWVSFRNMCPKEVPNDTLYFWVEKQLQINFPHFCVHLKYNI